MNQALSQDEEFPPARKQNVRLWLRLLSCTQEIERDLRTRLRREFACTLAQFDLLSALERAQKPLTKTELSRLLMVSNGNITGLVNRMVRDGLISHATLREDRRVKTVAMTDKGANAFQKMVGEHEQWLVNIFEDLTADEIAVLVALLTRLKKSVKHSIGHKA